LLSDFTKVETLDPVDLQRVIDVSAKYKFVDAPFDARLLIGTP